MKSNLLKNNVIVAVSQYILATLFIFSGVAKAINPFGLSNQFGDYFNAMGVEFLSGTQLFWAIALPAFEILLGLVLAFGIYRKIAAWTTLFVMSGFTILTLWIALFNPVNDCGCFGEVLKISNWATFWKNIVLLIFTVIFFMSRGQKADKLGNFYTVTIAIFAFIVPFYFLWTLPPLDATPYKIDANLIEILDDNDGVTTLPILDDQWNDHRNEYINDSVSTLFIVSPKLEHITGDYLKPIVDDAKGKKTKVILLTSAPIEDATKIAKQLDVAVFNSDLVVLKTIIQNFQGGVVWVENGILKKKWAMSQVPRSI